MVRANTNRKNINNSKIFRLDESFRIIFLLAVGPLGDDLPLPDVYQAVLGRHDT